MTEPARPASVITVAYNCREAIGATIESVIAQGRRDVEYIVIDGGSTDGTLQVIDRYRERIDLLVSEPDGGVYDAMNKGQRLASGRYLLYMNAGDTFASAQALGHALTQLQGKGDEILLGGWLRRQADGSALRCTPSLDKGAFNHQATLYSRSIHRWHGEYLTVPGLTTADYLFFATLFRNPNVAFRTTNEPIASIDPTGVSAGLQTLMQKTAIDLLCGSASRTRVAAIALLHPMYYRVKCLLKRTP